MFEDTKEGIFVAKIFHSAAPTGGVATDWRGFLGL
jgi:hypothetical protein